MRGSLWISATVAWLWMFCGSGCATSKVSASPQGPTRLGLFDRMKGPSLFFSRSNRVKNRNLKPALIAQKVKGFRWPLRKVQVTSPFGLRPRDFHEGIDLRAKTGTPVYAAQSGVVIYADSKIRGYGRMVVLRHSNEISTIYAHNSRVKVRRGDRVRQGQQIAISGSTGRTHGPHLHFEVRHGLIALNPSDFLPQIMQPRLTAAN